LPARSAPVERCNLLPLPGWFTPIRSRAASDASPSRMPCSMRRARGAPRARAPPRATAVRDAGALAQTLHGCSTRRAMPRRDSWTGRCRLARARRAEQKSGSAGGCDGAMNATPPARDRLQTHPSRRPAARPPAENPSQIGILASGPKEC
jgi:hypothetical protein